MLFETEAVMPVIPGRFNSRMLLIPTGSLGTWKTASRQARRRVHRAISGCDERFETSTNVGGRAARLDELTVFPGVNYRSNVHESV
jgi:hypothetical protein